MRSSMRVLRDLWRDPRGATAVEYGLILALVVIGVIGSIAALGQVTGDIWNGVATNVIAHGPRG